MCESGDDPQKDNVSGECCPMYSCIDRVCELFNVHVLHVWLSLQAGIHIIYNTVSIYIYNIYHSNA